MVREPVEQRRRHLGVGEHARPLGEGEIGRHDDRSALVEATDEVEQELAARLGEGQIAEFVHDDEIGADQTVGETALAAELDFAFEPVDQIDDIEEAGLAAPPDAAPRDADGDVALAGACPADQHDVPLRIEEGARAQALNQLGIDRRAFEGELGELFGQWELGEPHLVVDRARVLGCDLGLKQRADHALDALTALDAGSDDFVIGGAHASELELAHQIEDLRAFHVAPPHEGRAGDRSGRSRRSVRC